MDLKQLSTFKSLIDQYLRTIRLMQVRFIEPSKLHAGVIIPRATSTRSLSRRWQRGGGVVDWK
jgi:uridine kinase